MNEYRDDETAADGGFDPLQLWRVFSRRKWLFIIPFFLCLGVAAIAIHTQTPIYFSSAQLQVIQETTTARSLPQESPRYDRRGSQDAESLVMIRTIVTSPRFLRRIVSELNLHRPLMAAGAWSQAPAGVTPELWEDQVIGRVARQLAERVRIGQDDQHLFSIGMRDSDPDRAHLLTRRVLDDFLAEERANRLQPSSATRDFLEGQRRIYQDQLTQAQGRLGEFQRSVVNETTAGNPVTADNLNDAESLLTRLRSQAFDAGGAELMNLERSVLAALDRPPTLEECLRDADVAAATRELASLEYDAALREIQGREAGAAEQGSTLGLSRLNLNNLVEAMVARRHAGLTAPQRNRVSQYAFALLDHEVARRVGARLDQNIRELRDFMARQPQQSAQLADYQQEVTRLQELLQRIELDIQQENLRLAANMSEIGYRIVVRQDPQRPVAPIEPNKPRMAMMGLLLSLALGGGLVLLAEFTDRSFRSLKDIERTLDVKVIGTLPMIETGFLTGRRRRKFWVWVLLAAAILAVAGASFLFIYPKLS